MLTVTPVSYFGVNGTVGTGRDNYPDWYFGLRDNNHDSWSIGFDVVPNDTVSAGVNYGYEKYTALQWSRNSNPGVQFADPTRDWDINSSDKAKTWSANLDLLKTLPKTDIRLSYDRTDGNSAYLYGVVPNSTLPAPVQSNLQPKNRTQVAKADAQYYVRANIAVGAGYRVPGGTRHRIRRSMRRSCSRWLWARSCPPVTPTGPTKATPGSSTSRISGR